MDSLDQLRADLVQLRADIDARFSQMIQDFQDLTAQIQNPQTQVEAKQHHPKSSSAFTRPKPSHQLFEMAKNNTQQIASDDIGQPHSHSAPSGFLSLPLEIRRMVYSFLIPRNRTIIVTWPMFACGLASFHNDNDFFNPHHSRYNVLRLSRKISDECLDILYGENIFQVSLNGGFGEDDLEHNFTERNRGRIRYLLVLMTNDSLSNTPQIPLWASLLPNLKLFQIIAEQPVEARAYREDTTLEQELNDWGKWAMAYFNCFRRYLGTATRVELDDDNRKEARSLADRYLPPAYRKIRHPRGDFVFQRGQYSIGSGYWDYDDTMKSYDV